MQNLLVDRNVVDGSTCPRAGPSGGEGAALPAAMHIFNTPDNCFAIFSSNFKQIRPKT